MAGENFIDLDQTLDNFLHTPERLLAASRPTHSARAAKKLKSGTNTIARRIATYQPNTKLQKRPRKKLGQVIQVNNGTWQASYWLSIAALRIEPAQRRAVA